jgi:hypothetical protein
MAWRAKRTSATIVRDLTREDAQVAGEREVAAVATR